MIVVTTWPPFSTEWGAAFVFALMLFTVGVLVLLFRRFGWF